MKEFLLSLFIFLVSIHFSVALEEQEQEPQIIQTLKRQVSCFCEEKVCQCCATIRAPRINFVQTGCLKATYIAEDHALSMSFSVNGTTLWHNKISGKNPPPVCIPIPQFPFIRICIIIKDIHFEEGHLHLCPDLEIRVPFDITLLVISFDCLKIGADGVSIHKPNQTISVVDGDRNIQKRPRIYLKNL